MALINLDDSSEIRMDYRTGSYCVIVPGRSNRPEEVEENDIAAGDLSKCPFEPGNESQSSEKMRIGDPWKIRVIANRFPELSETTPVSSTDGLLSYTAGYGSNEIIIDSPSHFDKFEEMHSDQLWLWLNTVLEREQTLYSERYIKYVQIFKNYGHLAGASLGHPHTQIMAWPVVIGKIDYETRKLKKYKETDGKCLYEDVRTLEEPRKLFENNTFYAVAPFGSRATAESMIIPKRHVNYAVDLSTDEKRDLIDALTMVLKTNNKLFGRQPYNFTFHDMKDDPDFHMHVEIYPRLSMYGGIEIGEDVFINTVSPEDYAEKFRKNAVA